MTRRHTELRLPAQMHDAYRTDKSPRGQPADFEDRPMDRTHLTAEMAPRAPVLRSFVSGLVALATCTTSLAATVEVSNLNDSGPGSLRAAISNLPTDQNNTILITSPFGVLTLQSSLPTLRGTQISISGNYVIIDGNAQFSIFISNTPVNLQNISLRSGAGSGDSGCIVFRNGSSLERVQVTDCRAGATSSNAYGGGATLIGNSVVRSSYFANNLARGTGTGGNQSGGGLYHGNGSLLIEDSTFDGNRVEVGSSQFSDGGGIYTYASSAVLRRVRVINNHTVGTEASGGGLYCAQNSQCLIEQSYFGNNSSQNVGGAILATQASLSAINTTFYGNEAALGGAIFAYAESSARTLALVSNTFKHNTALSTGFGRQGGHLAVNGTPTVARFANNALAEVRDAGTACFFYASNFQFLGDGYNRSADSSCANLMQTNSNAQLASADFGLGAALFSGYVETLIPQRQSALINAGSPADVSGSSADRCPSIDARNTPRPQVGFFGGELRCDIGAVEFSEALFHHGFED